ncbi:hydroxyacylglutathione hydrolase [Spinellus fusiger]|nr:hydroxyacylglutathione hydrolase [Spinellus fusiger]
MLIDHVPCLKDNYAYLLLDEVTKTAMAVDPVEPEKVMTALASKYPDYILKGILTTHHHWDHAGGNSKLLASAHTHLPCYGGSDRVQGITHTVKDTQITLGSLHIQCIPTFGHTMDHLCYYVHDTTTQQKAVFTGDCLFSSGCGRFFEGTPSDMWAGFQRLVALPKDTLVYFGHEYTYANLRFAVHVEPNNPAVHAKIAWAKERECTTPSSLENEAETNPFLRCDQGLLGSTKEVSPEEVLGQLRKMKDNF